MKSEKAAKYSWALYDWANSAFVLTIISGFFPIFFKEFWLNTEDATLSTYYLGMANSGAAVVVALMAPFLGAIADRGNARKKFMLTFAFLGLLMTIGLLLVQRGYWQVALFFFIFSTVGWSSANVFYDSLLPSVASKNEVDFVSSLGYALGYIGGGLLFLANVIFYLNYEFFGISESSTAVKINFLSVSIWWALFTIPFILYVKEPSYKDAVPIRKAIMMGWYQLVHTLQDLKRYKIVLTFLIAYWLYIDGVDTIIRMAVDYGNSLNFAHSTLITALLMVQFIAFPATLGYNWIASKIGVKNAVLIGIVGYIIITFFGAFMSKEWHFYILAAAVGLFQGGIQALSRSLYSRIIPKDKVAEFFGFYNMLGKFAAVIGPIMMGYVARISGNTRIGILTILLLFILGALILWKVDIREGEKKVGQNYS